MEHGHADESMGTGSDGASDRLQAIAFLCRQIGGFRQKSFVEQRRFLEMVGLSDADIERVLTLLRQLAEAQPSASASERRNSFRERRSWPSRWINPVWFVGRFVNWLLWRIRAGPYRCSTFVESTGALPIVQYFQALSCPIGWQPSVVAPVFHGVRDYGTADGAPGALRVFYPSLDGSPDGAEFLQSCGQYPLVIFLHGNCTEQDHYKKWYQLPGELARSGFVVVVPRLPAIESGESPFQDGDLQLAADALQWMRNAWEHQDQLMCPPATGIVGHSYGALLGARLVTRVPVAAYVSLSGVWLEWEEEWSVLGTILGPSLFTWGSGNGSLDVDAALEGGAAGLWNLVPAPKHKVAFAGANHWDYLRESDSTCAQGSRGPCDLVGTLAADLTALFLSKYMPPEHWVSLKASIGNTLLPPAMWQDQLTPEQDFYAGGHLFGLTAYSTNTQCSAIHTWQTGSGGVTVSNTF